MLSDRVELSDSQTETAKLSPLRRYAMVQELDSSFDACCFVGYHGHAAHPSNPLSHTNTGLWNRITLNGEDLSEYLQHSYAAALEGVQSSSCLATSASATLPTRPTQLPTRSPQTAARAKASRH